jgi:hypothetical protein
MENQSNNFEQQQISRREVLKALAATSGALAAAAFLPDRWTPPVLQSGVLPAHAQTSVCATVTLVESGFCEENCPPGYVEWGLFQYDPSNLTPSSVSIQISCFQSTPPTVTVSFENTAPGQVTVYLGYEPGTIGDCYAESITITFREGCIGIWQQGEPGLTSRRGLLR